MKKENIEKWFGSLKVDENTGNYTDEFIPGKKLTLDNAKEFYFDFDCSIVNFIERTDIYQDWKNLNISIEKVTEWTTAFYSKDILKYDGMNFKNKLFYCEKLGGLLECFNKPLIIDITKKFIDLFSYKDIEEIYDIGKRRIAQSIITYLKDFITNGEVISKDRFTGYLPQLVNINEIDLANHLINILIKFLSESPEAFYGNGLGSLAYYYDILMKFNDTFNLKYNSIIESLKPEIPYDVITEVQNISKILKKIKK
jgi:hypothetical protein